MKHYDNYDYESAYDKQAEKLQEWEIEKLISEQRVSCLDRKSTRLNSSHVSISYAVFCLKKKKNITNKYELIPDINHKNQL